VILLIVCANITHLQLVRATREMRAVTIRTALGATRKSLALRALSEAMLLALGGTIAALALAIPALRLLVHLAPSGLPRLADVHLNADVFIFSFVVSFVVMAITALLPVWRSWHVDPATALRQDASRGTESRRSMHLRNGLIVAEVALTLTLSVTAMLLTRQLIAQGREDLGFATQSLITLDTHVVERTPYPDPPTDKSPAAIAAYRATQLEIAQTSLVRLDATLDSLAHTPGVLSVSAIDGAPMGFGGSDVGYAVKGRQVFAPPFENLQNANIRAVTPGLFNTMGIPLLRGRGLDANDRIGAPPVLMIDETLARTVFPNQDPIGKQIMCGYDEVSTWWTIVGVVGSIRNDAPGAPPAPTFYVPVAQHPDRAEDLQVVVRAAGTPAAMTETLRNTLRVSHPELSVKATTMLENIGETQRADQFRSLLFTGFAGVSILLAAIGMYGVTAYTVAQRRFEFGLRFALGANRSQVLQMVLRNGLRVACVGVALGIGITIGLMRLLSSVLGKLPAFDTAAYAIAICSVLVIAFLATLLPAHRAATIDPMQALRTE
jgi:putative ABC transport system permease protein